MSVEKEWVKVSFAIDCNADGECSVCGKDFATCPCPGPTQDGFEYREVDGILEARPTGEIEP